MMLELQEAQNFLAEFKTLGLRQMTSLGIQHLLGFQTKTGDTEESMGTEQDHGNQFKVFSE